MNETVHKHFPPLFIHEAKGKRHSIWGEMKPRNFFAELKRRHVYRVAIAYGVVAWLLIQVATQVFPFFELSNFVVRVVVAASVLGFPVALIIAWAFEMTPEGLKRADDVAPDDYIPRWSTRKFFRIPCQIVPISAMGDEPRNNTKTQLALAVAQGFRVTKWTRTHGVPRRTAFRWAKDPQFRAVVEACRRRTMDLAIGAS